MNRRQDNAFGVFINHFIKAYRSYDEDIYTLTLSGVKHFVSYDDNAVETLLERLQEVGFLIRFVDNVDTIDHIVVNFINESKEETGDFIYHLNCSSSITELSARANLSYACIIIMQVLSKFICARKTLYKAIVLDLDDTLWKGILSEDGIESIRNNLASPLGVPYISFMKFVRQLAEDHGIFVAICSRNDSKEVIATIDNLDEALFPLKKQIDCIIANNNNKSDNLSLIIEQLSILPNSVIFIDDNEIVRDEIKEQFPDVFVPEWNSHFDLMTALIGGCVFDRNCLSISSQNRRRNFRIIQSEKRNCALPKLFVNVVSDYDHIEAQKLYSKSNQFIFSRCYEKFSEEYESIFFEIFRENGERLDVCSAATYSYKEGILHVFNWAMSCRYFEIGLEELMMIYLYKIADGKIIQIDYIDTGKNKKVNALIEKYPDAFVFGENNTNFILRITDNLLEILKHNTRLEFKQL